jgi:serine/threonine-protein kinase
MSPEQLRSAKHVDARADIWSVGVILYELLTGELPFFGENVGAVFAAILEIDPPPPSTKSLGIPAALSEVILRCLRRKPEERWSSALELSIALSPWATQNGRALVNRMGARASLPDVLQARAVAKITETISSVPPAASTIPPGSRRSIPPWAESMKTRPQGHWTRIAYMVLGVACIVATSSTAVWKLSAHAPAAASSLPALPPSQTAVIVPPPPPVVTVPVVPVQDTITTSVQTSAPHAPEKTTPRVMKDAGASDDDRIFGRH